MPKMVDIRIVMHKAFQGGQESVCLWNDRGEETRVEDLNGIERRVLKSVVEGIIRDEYKGVAK